MAQLEERKLAIVDQLAAAGKALIIRHAKPGFTIGEEGSGTGPWIEGSYLRNRNTISQEPEASCHAAANSG